MAHSKTEEEKRVRQYLAQIGRRGGVKSRRELSRSHAKQMVAIREVKRFRSKERKADQRSYALMKAKAS